MPGAWAGSVVHTTDSSVTMVEQTKWDKTKVKLKWVFCQLDEGRMWNTSLASGSADS